MNQKNKKKYTCKKIVTIKAQKRRKRRCKEDVTKRDEDE